MEIYHKATVHFNSLDGTESNEKALSQRERVG